MQGSIAPAKHNRGFESLPSAKPFIPWGFNYDRDYKGRLIEDYWETDWPTIESDLREMKALRANVVRVHLQFARFMDAPDRPRINALVRLEKLLALCSNLGLYVDITGLGCYRESDVPAWYRKMNQAKRWQAQANFWRSVALHSSHYSSVFAYDLMNEPVVPSNPLPSGAWVHPTSLDGYHYVQYIALDPGADPAAVAKAWAHQLVSAIRQVDSKHLITVGFLSISQAEARAIAPEIDFISVHIYPESGKIDDSLRALAAFSIGKPIVIEETFPLYCRAQELESFIERSRSLASGWLGFYQGQTPDQLRRSKQIHDAMMLQWLELFEKLNPRN